ncbi:unnamed protein product [Tuber melanosporum]|uniref:(Perigord truffle) hypothetical protein n=1 Tax=Tuber melanosporum (strain Mel28) TaxID=656061 RepID=D5GGI5_TUBMM|nr:uncharacterized protein GSTUM_00002033001 [Tuber melanosporum]CAZ83628.1 unnamed protein product [Tuber melanosporum]
MPRLAEGSHDAFFTLLASILALIPLATSLRLQRERLMMFLPRLLFQSPKEVAIHRKAITDGFTEIKGWIKTMMVFGGGTIFFGFGSLAYKVMVYDVDAKKEMMAHTARVVHESEERLQTRFGSPLDNFEQKTQAQIENLKLETKSEIDKLGHLVELSTKKR